MKHAGLSFYDSLGFVAVVNCFCVVVVLALLFLFLFLNVFFNDTSVSSVISLTSFAMYGGVFVVIVVVTCCCCCFYCHCDNDFAGL